MTIGGGAGDLGSFYTSYEESQEPQSEVSEEDGEVMNRGEHEGLGTC